jgi:hypothetical protein
MALKRHPALQDYSREHHDELMLVWKIREGLKHNISPDRIQKFIVHHFNENTKFHMSNEENFVLKYFSENDPDRIKILKDHNQLKELFDLFSKNIKCSIDIIKSFAEILENHIRFEEREFFQRIQKDFSEEVILSMNPHSEKIECSIWIDPFWENNYR